jgi:glycosyltransferase involved in cell wall biosynthesis
MNICMFIMNEFTNDARVTKEITSLVKAGHRITVMALQSRTTPALERKDGAVVHRIPVRLRYFLPKGPVSFFLKYLEYVVRSVAASVPVPFDAFHAHDLETLPIGFILSKVKGKPLVYDSHELYVEYEKHGPVQKRFWRAVEKLLIHRTTRNITIDGSIADELSARYSIDPPLVLMNCTPPPADRKAERNLLREKLGIPPGHKIILYQGVVDSSRGMDVLLDAMLEVERAVLLIMGTGAYKTVLERRIRHSSLKKKVLFADPVPYHELFSYTREADIGVSILQNICLNNYFSLSNKFFEYLSAGLPVVFSDFPEYRKTIRENDVGLLVNEKDPHDVAKALNQLIGNSRLCRRMSRNALRMIRNRYNWTLEEKKLICAYRRLSAVPGGNG